MATKKAPAHFCIWGKPHGKERPRFYGNGHVTNSREQKLEEDKVIGAYFAAGYGPHEYNFPVRLVVTAHYLPPKRLPEVQRSWLIGKPAYCHNGSHPLPDIDNILKHVADSLTGSGMSGVSGGAWCDDTMCISMTGTSVFSDREYVEVKIIPLELDDPYGFYEMRAKRELELEAEREKKKAEERKKRAEAKAKRKAQRNAQQKVGQ